MTGQSAVAPHVTLTTLHISPERLAEFEAMMAMPMSTARFFW
jgi:hypothetical protein